MSNYERFEFEYRAALVRLFESDPDYAFSAARTTPEALAAKMVPGLISGGANKDGAACRAACRAVGIPHTYKAIRAYCAPIA